MRSVIMADDFDITKERTAVNEPSNSQLFDAEEMQAIREQYEERLEAEIGKREELEWQVRMMLATVRDAELDARRAADQMRKIHATLQSMLGLKPEETAAPVPAPAPRPAPVIGVAPVVSAAKLSPTLPGVGRVAPVPSKQPPRVAPPPIPLAAKNARGPLPPRPLNGYKRSIA
jgi:hypothetical protein